MKEEATKKIPGAISAREFALIEILVAASVRKGLRPSDGVHLSEDAIDAAVDAVNDAVDYVHDAATSAADAVHDAATSAADAVTDFIDRVNANQQADDQRDMDNWQNMMTHIDNALDGNFHPGEEMSVSKLSQAVRHLAAARTTTLNELLEARAISAAERAQNIHKQK